VVRVVTATAVRELVGQREPRIRHVPNERLRSRGGEAIEWAASVGLGLDDWQQDTLVDASRVDRDGRWEAMEIGVNVARQNGKGGILEAREGAGLFVWGEKLQTHTAHLFDTSLEAFKRLLFLVENSEECSRRVKRISKAHGEEGVELLTGERIRFRTRTAGGGRGFAGTTVYLDEAMFLTQFAIGSLMPTLSAQENPQLWYTGSAVDQDVHQHGYVFTGVRNRGLEGKSKALAYFEWSLDFDTPLDVPEDVLTDPEAWAAANPAFGIRISERFTESELEALDARTFAVERLGVGDYPELDDDALAVIPLKLWDALRDPESEITDGLVLTFDVSPDRRATVAASGRREDGLLHTEIVRNRPGTKWVVPTLKQLEKERAPAAIKCDSRGPVASLLPEIEKAGLKVETTSTHEYVEACGRILDIVDEAGFRHHGSDELRRAVRGAKTRTVGDAWAWSRRNSTVDISPLVAATIGLAAAAAPVRRKRKWSAT
jgi:hypothetical protein